MEHEFMPCPFCGTEPQVMKIGNEHTKMAVEVRCPKCRIQRTDATPKSRGYSNHDWLLHRAMVNWNERPVTTALEAENAALREELAKVKQEVTRLNVIINTPQDTDFLRAVSTEAEHQRQRWGSAHDAGKENSDWFWLIGYLAGKALRAAEVKNNVKAEHHIITTAAALANWHLAILRKTDMRPGIDGDAAMKVAG